MRFDQVDAVQFLLILNTLFIGRVLVKLAKKEGISVQEDNQQDQISTIKNLVKYQTEDRERVQSQR